LKQLKKFQVLLGLALKMTQPVSLLGNFQKNANRFSVRIKLQQALKIVFAIRNKQQKEHNVAIDRLRQAAERPANNLDTLSIISPSRPASSIAQHESDRRPSNANSVFSISSTPNMEYAHIQVLDSNPLYELP
jgi:hypothetical protein